MCPNQPSLDYVYRLLVMHSTITQPILYLIFCLVTPQKSPQQDFFSYLESLPSFRMCTTRRLGNIRHMFTKLQKSMMMTNPDGSEWNITTLLSCITIFCHVAPIDSSASSTEGLELENLLYMLKAHFSMSIHQESAIHESEFMDRVRNLREILIATIRKASQRYEMPSDSDQLIHRVCDSVVQITSGDLSTIPVNLPFTSQIISTTRDLTADEPNIQYGLKMIKITYMISRLILYKIFCLGTRMKPPQENFLTYLMKKKMGLSSKEIKRTFSMEHRRIMTENLDGSVWDMGLLFTYIRHGCEGMAPSNDPSWFSEGQLLENCLYRLKTLRNEVVHSNIRVSRAEFLCKDSELRQTFINTLTSAQLRYEKYMTTGQRDQLIQQVLVLMDQIKQEDPSEHMMPPFTTSQPTNTPGPAITSSQPTNMPGPATTACQLTSTPSPTITASQPTDIQGTSATVNQLSVYYGLKLIIMLWCVARPVMYKVLCLGTHMKPSDKNFIEYLKDLPQSSPVNLKDASCTNPITQPSRNVQPLTPPNYQPGGQKKFDGQQKRKIRNDLDGKDFDIALLHPCIMLGSVGVAPLEDPAWISEGTDLENCLYMMKKMRNNASHETLKLSESQFMERESELRTILTDTLNAAQLRYIHSMTVTERDQFIQEMNDNMNRIRDEVISMDELVNHSLPMLIQMFIPEATNELKEILSTHNALTMLDFVKSCGDKQMHLEIQNIFTRIKMVKGKEKVSQIPVDYSKLLTWIQAKAAGNDQEEDDETCEANEDLSLVQDEHEEEERDHENENKTIRPQILILEGPAGMGKTTLLMLMVKAWLDVVRGTGKESSKVTVEGLDNYDLVLKIQCRDQHVTSFEDLLKSFMNKSFLKYRNLLMCLTKECRLLIIIDGYDERNENSRRLVDDIMHQLKHSQKSTILCTTRPESLLEFRQTVPSEYEENVVELTGIPVDLRAEFVRKYFKEIKRVMGSRESGQELVDKVEREKLKEHYKLPLNLAILAWLFYYQPEKIKAVTSQTELYYHTHQLLKDKLDERLAQHDMTKNKKKWEREYKVEDWLSEFYLKTFLTLSDNRLNLDKPVIKDLRFVCLRLELPPDEVLGAFLTTKTTSEGGKHLEQYSVAHKGLHEYYAAVHIMRAFQCGQDRPTTIIAAMEKTLGVGKVKLEFYLNMLKHLAGLMDLEMDNLSDVLVGEIVNLIEQAGESSQDAWLEILEEVKISHVFLEAVARRLPTQDGLMVRETRAEIFSLLLPLLSSTQVTVDIRSDPAPLLHGLTCHSCTSIELWHHWYHPNSHNSPPSQLQHLLCNDNLKVFRGKGPGPVGLPCLPASLTDLMIAIPDNQATPLLPLLKREDMHLEHLEVHVTAAVSPEAINSQLPTVTTIFDLPAVSLVLSDVKEGEEHQACEVAAKLQPPHGYWRLEFPRSTLTANGWRSLIAGLHRRTVSMWLLCVPNNSTTEECSLHHFTKAYLSAELKRMDFSAWEC